MVDNGTRPVARAQLDILVAKAHVAILNSAGRHLQIRSTRLILNIGDSREHLVHALKAGDGFLIRLGRIDERLKRRAEQRNVEREGCHIDRLQLALGNEPTAQQHHDHIERAREQTIRRGVDAHGVIHVFLGRKVAIVRGTELRAFGLLIGKAFDHTHARQRILQLRIDAADLFVRRLADIEQVVDHAAHHVTRAVAIKVRKAKTLVLIEQVLTHLGLHARAHHVAPIAHKVAAGAAGGIHQHQSHRDHTERLHNGSLALGKQPAAQIAQDNGKRQVNGGEHQGANGIGNKKPHLGLVVRQKTLQHVILKEISAT